MSQTITDQSGMTLYTFDKDQRGSGESMCRNDCATNWPPVPAANANGENFGSITRADGMKQLTHDGWPVYYYAADSAPGDTKGDGVGGVWHAIKTKAKNGVTAGEAGGGY